MITLYEIVLKLMNATITLEYYLDGTHTYIYDVVVNTVHYVFTLHL